MVRIEGDAQSALSVASSQDVALIEGVRMDLVCSPK
jgi:hypothetical protein